MAPTVADRLETSSRQTFPLGLSPNSRSWSFGVSHSSPAMAPKDSCRLMEAAAKGFASRIKNRAADSVVGGSLSR